MKNISDQITKMLCEYLALGIYKVNEKLPSVRELSSQYHVNPNTIAKVYTNLEEKGYIYALPQKGYYVQEVNDLLKQNVQKEMQPLIHEVYLLSKIAQMTQEDVMELFKKEASRYD